MNELRKCGIYKMEFYAAMKKNEILSFTSKWMELENIILSEVRQAQKTKNCMFSVFTSRANIAMLLNLGHMTRREHIREIWGQVVNPKHVSI
jgi:hypothetical protein